MLERNQWLAIGLISGFAYMLGRDKESFGAESFGAEYTLTEMANKSFRDIDKISGFVADRLNHTQESWANLTPLERKEVLYKIRLDEDLDYLYDGGFDDGETTILTKKQLKKYLDENYSSEDIIEIDEGYIAKYKNVWDVEYLIVKELDYDEMEAESFGAEDKCDICSEGPIYEKDVNIEDYDDPIQVCQSCFDDIFTDIAAESFGAEDSRRRLKVLMEGKSDAEKKRISKMVQVRGLENTIAELLANEEVFAATTFDEDDDSPKINREDWMPRTDCEICARPFTINRFGQQLIQHYLKESDNGEKAWKSKKNTDGTRRTARNLAGFFLYEYGLDALNQYVLFQDKTGISDKVIELLRLSLVERVIAGDVVNLIEMMDMGDEVDDEPMFGKKFEEDFGSEGN